MLGCHPPTCPITIRTRTQYSPSPGSMCGGAPPARRSAGYSALDEPPSLFVLAGNFQSYDANTPSVHYGRLREQFTALGRLLNQYTALRVGGQCARWGIWGRFDAPTWHVGWAHAGEGQICFLEWVHADVSGIQGRGGLCGSEWQCTDATQMPDSRSQAVADSLHLSGGPRLCSRFLQATLSGPSPPAAGPQQVPFSTGARGRGAGDQPAAAAAAPGDCGGPAGGGAQPGPGVQPLQVGGGGE